MSIKLPGLVAQKLQFFEEYDDKVCEEFCEAALEFLTAGQVNEKLCRKVSGKLSRDSSEVEMVLESLMLLYKEMSCAKSTLEDLESFSHGASLPRNLLCALTNIFPKLAKLEMTNESSLSSAAGSSDVPQYAGMEWRLDVELETRFMTNKFDPIVTLKLDTTSGGEAKAKEHFFEINDFGVLQHIVDELEVGLSELKTREYRKLTRSLNAKS